MIPYGAHNSGWATFLQQTVYSTYGRGEKKKSIFAVTILIQQATGKTSSDLFCFPNILK